VILYLADSVFAFKYITVDEAKHELPLKTIVEGKEGNFNPKGGVSLNKLYGFHNFCQRPRNNGTHKTTTMKEHSNLEIYHDLKIANFYTSYMPQQRQIFDHLTKKYRDGSTWADDDLSTHCMRAIQHRIPGKGEDKPLRKRPGNTHMLFTLLIQEKLTNILDDWITCKVRHHTCFSNLNFAHKTFGKILLCIDLRNLNCSQNKNNYLMPSSEPMLHTVPEAVVLSSLKGLLECYQVPVVESGGLALVYEKLHPHTYHLQ